MLCVDFDMASPSLSSLVVFLREKDFLTRNQLDELSKDNSQFQEAPSFLRELVRRGWLTSYQASQIAHGNEKELLLGPYHLLEPIGEGGMGKVFKARHVRMDRIVALKIIPEDCLGNDIALARFNREVQAVAKLSHPNIVTAYEVNQEGTTHYFTMEFMEGIDLAKLVRQSGPLPIPQACDYIRQAALGLQHAHEKGLVHRDIKPGNLIVGRSLAGGPPVVKILDFGLARSESRDEKVTRLTKIGHVLGTVDYISPEQAGDARGVDIRSDIFSLGCSLFYLLTGKAPFTGADTVARMLARLLEDAPSVRTARPQTPAALEKVLTKMLARNPAERYRTPAEVAAALEPFAAAAELKPPSERVPTGPPTPVKAGQPPTLREQPWNFDEPASAEPMRMAKAKGRGIPIWAMATGGVAAMAAVIVLVVVLAGSNQTKTVVQDGKKVVQDGKKSGKNKLEIDKLGQKPPLPIVVPDPVLRWKFATNAIDSIHGIEGILKGGATVVNGWLRLDGKKACPITKPFPVDLGPRTLEVWLTVGDRAQGDSTVLQLVDGRGWWDGILYATKKPGNWYPGSSYNHRSAILDAPMEDAKPGELIQLVAVYRADNSITLYRNGKVYGSTFTPSGQSSGLQTYKKGDAFLILGSNRGDLQFFAGDIAEARVYDVPLNEEEIATLFRSGRPKRSDPAQSAEVAVDRFPAPTGDVLILKEDRLAQTDSRDTVKKTSFRKVYPQLLAAKSIYCIDVTTSDFDPYVRLETVSGEKAAETALSKGEAARIVYRTPNAIHYHIVVASGPATRVGAVTSPFQPGGWIRNKAKPRRTLSPASSARCTTGTSPKCNGPGRIRYSRPPPSPTVGRLSSKTFSRYDT
jgi:serine/threonine protein kinase